MQTWSYGTFVCCRGRRKDSVCSSASNQASLFCCIAMFCRKNHKSFCNSSCSSILTALVLLKTIHLLNIPFILLQSGKSKLLANLVFLKLFHPVDAVSRTSSATPLKGRSTGSFSSSYSKANVAAAWIAASASTSHLALLTDATAAKREDNDGNNATNATLDITPGAPLQPW